MNIDVLVHFGICVCKYKLFFVIVHVHGKIFPNKCRGKSHSVPRTVRNKALPPDGTVAVNPTMYVPGTGLSYSLRGES